MFISVLTVDNNLFSFVYCFMFVNIKVSKSSKPFDISYESRQNIQQLQIIIDIRLA